MISPTLISISNADIVKQDQLPVQLLNYAGTAVPPYLYAALVSAYGTHQVTAANITQALDDWESSELNFLFYCQTSLQEPKPIMQLELQISTAIFSVL